MRRWTLLTVASLLFFSPLASARAEFVVTIGNQTVPAGETGYVDVMIASDSVGGDLLNAFNFDFRISTLGQTRLEFVGTQPDPQLTDSNYVFFGNSFDHDDPLNQFIMPVGVVSDFPEPMNRFVGGDSAADLVDLLITSTPKLLARLQVNTSTGLSPNPGDTFTISLDGSGSSFQYGDPFNPTPVLFSSIPGTVTISEVPEPGTFATLLAGVLTSFGYWALRVRRQGK